MHHPNRSNRTSRGNAKHQPPSPTEMSQHPDSSQLLHQSDKLSSDKQTTARPAMPSGTVRARRLYPRYRKGKTRAEPQLEPAAPNPNAAEFNPRTASNNASPQRANNPRLPAQPVVSSVAPVESAESASMPTTADVNADAPAAATSPAATHSNHALHQPADLHIQHTSSPDRSACSTSTHPHSHGNDSRSSTPVRHGSPANPSVVISVDTSEQVSHSAATHPVQHHTATPPVCGQALAPSAAHGQGPSQVLPDHAKPYCTPKTSPVKQQQQHAQLQGAAKRSDRASAGGSAPVPSQSPEMQIPEELRRQRPGLPLPLQQLHQMQSVHPTPTSQGTNYQVQFSVPLDHLHGAQAFPQHINARQSFATMRHPSSEPMQMYSPAVNSSPPASSSQNPAVASNEPTVPSGEGDVHASASPVNQQEQAVKPASNSILPHPTGQHQATRPNPQLCVSQSQDQEQRHQVPFQPLPTNFPGHSRTVPAAVSGGVSNAPGRASPVQDENRQVNTSFTPAGNKVTQPQGRSLPRDFSKPAVQGSDVDKDGGVAETDKLSELVSSIRASAESGRPRPLICQDITNSNADTLRISRLPRGVTYDRLYSMVEPFGEVDDLTWTASDPYVCEVTYRDPAAAHEAKHFLGDAIVGNDSEPPLKAELRSRDPGAQLFVGDLTPDVTEEMLETTFSELVGEPVTALLKRDPDSFSPIGYGFLSFTSESSANFALVAGHRSKVGNACVRVGRAERNTYLYVSDLSSNVCMDELKQLFGKFGTLVEEDTCIVRRSYAFIRYKNRGAAEKAKRTLDKTDLKGRISVRYAEAEPLKACVAVQFHSSVPRPPNSLKDLLSATFSKHGNCSVEIPRLQNGMWRKVAFVTFHGEPIAANLAALEAVQSIRFVSSLPVCCQFARELIPRLPSRGLAMEKMATGECEKSGDGVSVSERNATRNFLARKAVGRRGDAGNDSNETSNGGGRSGEGFDHRLRPFSNENSGQGNGADFVPVYVPISALQHPSQQMAGVSGVQGSDADYSGYHWANRMMVAGGNGAPQNIHPSAAGVNANYNSFAPLQDRMMRW